MNLNRPEEVKKEEKENDKKEEGDKKDGDDKKDDDENPFPPDLTKQYTGLHWYYHYRALMCGYVDNLNVTSLCFWEAPIIQQCISIPVLI